MLSADVILHVRDISHDDAEAQAEDVDAILADLGVDGADEKLIEVWNKLDRVDASRREGLAGGAQGPVAVSALTGEGIGDLTGGDRGRGWRATGARSTSTSTARMAARCIGSMSTPR